MLQCATCKAPIEAEHRFCGACGAKVTLQPEKAAEPAKAVQQPAAASRFQKVSDNRERFRGSSQEARRNRLMIGLVIAIAIGLLIIITSTRAPSSRFSGIYSPQTSSPGSPTSTSSSVMVQESNADEDLARAVYARIVKPADIAGVIGIVEDRHAAAKICRATGQCMPAEGTEINTGDTILAPKRIMLHIDDQNGYSKHQLLGEIRQISIAKLAGGALAIDLTLARGSLVGTLRRVSHVIRIGDAFCIASGVDYAAEADTNSGRFKIVNGSGYCYHKLRRIKLHPGNPNYVWQF